MADDQQQPNSDGYVNQLGLLTQSVSRHEQTLESLKNVPLLLTTMANQMGIPIPSTSAEAASSEADDDREDDLSFSSDIDFVSKMINQAGGGPHEEEENLNEDLLSAFKDCEKGLEVGPEVGTTVAEAYNRTVTRPLSKETITGLNSKMKVPGNCKSLLTPKVNSEIWGNLPTKAKITDLGLQALQQSVSYAIASLAISSNEITQAVTRHGMPTPLASKLLQINMDAGNILGHNFQTLTNKRRMEIKPFLNSDFSGICSGNVPVTEYLFGDDLKETLKHSKNSSQVVKQTFAKNFGRSRPYDKFRSFRGHQNRQPLNRQLPPWRPMRRGGGWNQQRPFSPNPQQFSNQQKRQ